MPTENTEPRRLDVRDFLSAGPCQQRPGILNTTHGKVMTTCPECPGLMWAGDCARDHLAQFLDQK